MTHLFVEVMLPPRYTWHGLIRKFARVPRVTRKTFLKAGSYCGSIKSLENPKELLPKKYALKRMISVFFKQIVKLAI